MSQLQAAMSLGFFFGFDICACADQLREQTLFSITILLLTCAVR